MHCWEASSITFQFHGLQISKVSHGQFLPLWQKTFCSWTKNETSVWDLLENVHPILEIHWCMTVTVQSHEGRNWFLVWTTTDVGRDRPSCCVQSQLVGQLQTNSTSFWVSLCSWCYAPKHTWQISNLADRTTKSKMFTRPTKHDLLTSGWKLQKYITLRKEIREIRDPNKKILKTRSIGYRIKD